MILDSDMAQLEWRVAAELSRDKVMVQEIVDGVDAHGMNCTGFMELPLTKENRQITKIASFRMIYGGSAYAFYADPKMPGFSLKKWERIVEGFYTKYSGLAAKQDEWVATVHETGRIVLPSGRKLFPPMKEKGGVLDYQRPNIVNYPVQAYATADIMPLAMGIIHKRLKKIGAFDAGNLFINQVHDSIIYDTINHKWATWIGHVCVHTFRQLPKIITLLGWQDTWAVPLDGDLSIGKTWGCVEEQKIDPYLMKRLAKSFSLTDKERNEILYLWGSPIETA